MTSDRAAKANRRNAKASTGPRTAPGKTRSAQNAYKHGLAAEASDPHTEAAAEHLAALLAGDLGGDRTILDAARAVAEAQSHLRRVRAVKGAMIRDGADLPEIRPNADGVPAPTISAELLQGLERLERYERRAFSLRKSAIRRFVALAGQAAHTTPETAGT